jgi:hypothetical protein
MVVGRPRIVGHWEAGGEWGSGSSMPRPVVELAHCRRGVDSGEGQSGRRGVWFAVSERGFVGEMCFNHLL